MKVVKANTESEYYKLSGQRLEKDHHPHYPKTTFEMSSIAVALLVGLWILGLLFITTWVFRWN